ncbi:MAG: hypothetical protein FJ216_04815 [Ignavibacteria bacterium]|nr:hypothetical protein [Ignavibacteria bacterium]
MNKKNYKKEILIKTALVIAIIVVVNVISTRFFTRVDLTRDKTFTLSDISKNIVDSLDDKLVIKVFFSENLPAPYNNLRRDLKDILNDYRTYSHGNLIYEFYNPSGEEGNTELAKEAQKYGIQPGEMRVIENDRVEVKVAYMGMAFLYKGKQEVIPWFQSLENIEYEITGKIKKIMTDKKKKIGFLSGHGEFDPTKSNQLYQKLSEQYDITTVMIGNNRAVPIDVDILMIVGPKAKITENQKYMIDQFIMRGGKVAWLLNRIAPVQQMQMAVADVVPTEIDDLLLNYGIRINNDLVRDVSCLNFGLFGWDPYMPFVTNIDPENPAFQYNKRVLLSLASTIDLSAAQGKNIIAKPLMLSSDKSGRAENVFFLSPDEFKNKPMDSLFNQKNLILGATYTGNFTSLYKDKTIPIDTSADAFPVYDSIKIDQTQKETKMLVIGDGDFIDESIVRYNNENMFFFMNIIDYLADDIGLAQIRSKTASEQPMEPVSDGTKKFVKFFNLIFPPLIVLLFGLWMWNNRKRRRNKLKSF